MTHFYRARLVKDGPFVGVKTWFGAPVVNGETLDRSPRWQALIHTDADPVAILTDGPLPIEVDGVTLRSVEAIAEHEYRFLLAHGEWCDATTANHPRTTPRQAVDFNTLPLRF
jgi:hypothetical protein